MSADSREVANDQARKKRASSRTPAPSSRSSENRLPPPPSAINGDDEEVDLEAHREDYSDEPASPSGRFSFFGGNRNAPPPQPRMDDPESFRSYGTTPVDATHMVNRLMDQQVNTSPTETECTWAKILCLPGCGLFSAGSSMLAFALYLAAQQMKDIEKTKIICCSEAIAGTALACGCCCICAGVGVALASKRK